jgi:nitroimidazol reductase NimA-like FMN-containing flavoprotein (pyridoxamine 5'-phosphate oxidase superfamily)
MPVIKSISSPESEKLIRDFLREQQSGVLATADASACPHAATVYFAAEDDFCLVFTTKVETQKYKNMKENNQVAFVCTDEAAQTTVEVSGRSEEVTDPAVRQAALNRMYRFSEAAGKGGLPPIEKLFAGEYVTMRIVPQVMKMGIFVRPDSQSNEEIYETLLFDSRQ